ncbi:MAG: NUDIX pyrophosphatase [Candidatus Hatepunaea meridiana]|nr:NUDIX pyrophosphatase [Candidatus Hatepunaea meridiana]
MRAPFQVLIIPFRYKKAGPEYAILKRSDANYWQFIAGGGEDSETPLEAAKRESREETGVTGEIMKLDSMATVPKICFIAAESWGQDVYVIPEHCFALDVGNSVISLSSEHTELRWVSYEEAYSLLKWDSNRNALWELNERLKE